MNIVFIGDSYCSSSLDNQAYNESAGQQRNEDPWLPSWVDLASRQLKLDPYSFGAAGRSWYFSRYRWLYHADGDPDFMNQTAVIVFCHTEPNRYNTGNGNVSVSMLNTDYKSDDSVNRKKTQAVRLWATELIDHPFQSWAQKQWFYEIARILAPYPHIKQIHFNNFPFTVETSSILTGCVYTTPLIHLSLAELIGTTAEINSQAFQNDPRVNHFNSHNNRAMADLLVDSVNNYKTGRPAIDTTGFDIKNSNAFNWPNEYGSK